MRYLVDILVTIVTVFITMSNQSYYHIFMNLFGCLFIEVVGKQFCYHKEQILLHFLFYFFTLSNKISYYN